jgi:hypothetical protein
MIIGPEQHENAGWVRKDFRKPRHSAERREALSFEIADGSSPEVFNAALPPDPDMERIGFLSLGVRGAGSLGILVSVIVRCPGHGTLGHGTLRQATCPFLLRKSESLNWEVAINRLLASPDHRDIAALSPNCHRGARMRFIFRKSLLVRR